MTRNNRNWQTFLQPDLVNHYRADDHQCWEIPPPSLRNLITWNLGKTCPQIISLKFPKDKTLHLWELRELLRLLWENNWCLTLFRRHPLQDSMTALSTTLAASSAETERARLSRRCTRMLFMVERLERNVLTMTCSPECQYGSSYLCLIIGNIKMSISLYHEIKCFLPSLLLWNLKRPKSGEEQQNNEIPSYPACSLSFWGDSTPVSQYSGKYRNIWWSGERSVLSHLNTLCEDWWGPLKAVGNHKFEYEWL